MMPHINYGFGLVYIIVVFGLPATMALIVQFDRHEVAARKAARSRQ